MKGGILPPGKYPRIPESPGFHPAFRAHKDSPPGWKPAPCQPGWLTLQLSNRLCGLAKLPKPRVAAQVDRTARNGRRAEELLGQVEFAHHFAFRLGRVHYLGHALFVHAIDELTRRHGRGTERPFQAQLPESFAVGGITTSQYTWNAILTSRSKTRETWASLKRHRVHVRDKSFGTFVPGGCRLKQVQFRLRAEMVGSGFEGEREFLPGLLRFAEAEMAQTGQIMSQRLPDAR